MRDYLTLHLDTIAVLHLTVTVESSIMSIIRILRWVWNGPKPAVFYYELFFFNFWINLHSSFCLPWDFCHLKVILAGKCHFLRLLLRWQYQQLFLWSGQFHSKYIQTGLKGHLYITNHCLFRAVSFFPLMNSAYNLNCI